MYHTAAVGISERTVVDTGEVTGCERAAVRVSGQGQRSVVSDFMAHGSGCHARHLN